MCRTVTVVDDIVLEGEEIFYVSLETTDARVSLTLANSRASIVISDNDDSMSSLFFPTLTVNTLYDRHEFYPFLILPVF